MLDELNTATLAQRFAHFADYECKGASPLYERLTRGISADPAMLDLAAQATSRPVPNLFLAAVQFLLLRGAAPDLAAFYPTLGGAPPATDPYPLFRAFCLAHADAIHTLLQTRRVQTSEVRRCALLLPAFGLAAARARGRPLALVEIGASAGLNLLWDRYSYDYGAGVVVGDPSAPLRLMCELRGSQRPPIPRAFPAVASRVGIDLHPVDLGDDQAIDWLRALIWPEHVDRVARLVQAVAVARRDPPEVRAGDALDLLPGVLDAVPEQSMLCLYHTFVVNQFSEEGRARLRRMIEQYGARRDLACIAISGVGATDPQIAWLSFSGGAREERLLATCSGHGHWLAWHPEAITG